MEKILEIFRQDRLLHFMVGFFIHVGFSLFLNVYLTLIVVCLFALGKEIRDNFQEGNHFDIVDMLFTILPSFIMVIHFLLMH